MGGKSSMFGLMTLSYLPVATPVPMSESNAVRLTCGSRLNSRLKALTPEASKHIARRHVPARNSTQAECARTSNLLASLAQRGTLLNELVDARIMDWARPCKDHLILT